MEAFILILVIAGVGMTIAAVKSAGDNSDPIWKAAAQRLGLQLEHTDMAGSPVISGTRRGLSVRIDTYAKSGDNSRTYTRYRVSFEKSLGLGLPYHPEPAPPFSLEDLLQVESEPAETLFALGQTTSQAAEIFDIRFKGQAVAWSGTLTNVRSFRFDLVFGDVPGTRGEFDLRNATDPPAVGRVVKAVVQFPIDVEEKLRVLVDRRVAFKGILNSCDAFLQILFLTDGDICEVDT